MISVWGPKMDWTKLPQIGFARFADVKRGDASPDKRNHTFIKHFISSANKKTYPEHKI